MRNNLNNSIRVAGFSWLSGSSQNRRFSAKPPADVERGQGPGPFCGPLRAVFFRRGRGHTAQAAPVASGGKPFMLWELGPN